MAYPNEGTLVTDEREIAISETWDTQTDWEAYQSIDSVVISNGVVMLEETTIPDSVVHRWPIDEGSGTTFADAVGTADGTWSGGSWVADGSYIGGYGYSLNGTDDYGDTGATTPAGSLTLLATVDFSTDKTDIQYIKGVQNGGFAGGRLLRFRGDLATNQVEFQAVNDSDGIYTANYTLPSTGRYRIGGYVDTANNQIGVAVNGTIQSTTATSGSFSTQLSNHKIGRRPDLSNGFLLAEVDEPIMANEGYSSTQFTDDYNRQPWS